MIGIAFLLLALLLGAQAVVAGPDLLLAVLPVKNDMSVFLEATPSKEAVDRAYARLQAANPARWEVSMDADEDGTVLTVVGIDRSKDLSVVMDLVTKEGIRVESSIWGPTFCVPGRGDFDVVFMVMALIAQLSAYFIVYFIWQRRFPMERHETTWRPPRAAALGVLVGGACLISSGALGFVMERIGIPAQEQPWLANLVDSPAFWAVMPLIVIGAPVGEEVFFRGLVLRRLRTSFGVFISATVSSAIFAGIHFNPSATPIYFLYGVLLALSYLKTRTLIAPIVAHATINAVGLAGLWWS